MPQATGARIGNRPTFGCAGMWGTPETVTRESLVQGGGEGVEGFEVLGSGDKEEIVVAGAIDPEILFGGIGRVVDALAVEEGYDVVGASVHDEDRHLDVGHGAEVVELVEGEKRDACKDAEGGDEGRFDDQAGHDGAAGGVGGVESHPNACGGRVGHGQ